MSENLGPNRSARNMITATATSAIATLVAVAAMLPPTIRAATTGRYTAIARSSITSRFRTAGVSRLPRRPRSDNTFDTTPDEVIHVTPPNSTAASGVQPRSSPTITPGTAFSAMSTTPAARPVRSPDRSSESEYSSPSENSSRSTPISAASEMKPSVTSRSIKPPLPTARPASRYSGIAVIPIRAARRDSIASPRITTPISMKAIAESVLPAAITTTGISGASRRAGSRDPRRCPRRRRHRGRGTRTPVRVPASCRRHG